MLKEEDLLQKEIAEKLDISESWVSRIKNEELSGKSLRTEKEKEKGGKERGEKEGGDVTNIKVSDTRKNRDEKTGGEGGRYVPLDPSNRKQQQLISESHGVTLIKSKVFLEMLEEKGCTEICLEERDVR